MRGFGNRQPSVVSQSVRSPRGNGVSAFAITSGARDIDSTPPATKRSPSPAAIAWQAPTTALRPGRAEPVDGHARDRLRQPREQRGHARDVAVVLAGLVRAAEVDVFDLAGGDSGARDRLCDHERREVVRPHARKRAAVAADGRANGGEDDRAAHAATLADGVRTLSATTNSTRTPGCS